MIGNGAIHVAHDADAGAKRHWIAMPAAGLLTVGIVAIALELVARHLFLFTESPPFIETCMSPVDPVKGAWAKPSSACWDKKYESEAVEYRFNRCGHRAGIDCGVKPADAFRIVL